MSTSATTARPPRHRRVTDRQADTVERLVDAATAEVRTGGYRALTVRRVAKRAGVAPATAYTYFASKDHLVAEAFWRRLRGLSPVRVDQRRSPGARVAAALREVAELAAGEPELASAWTAALLADDPDVKDLRERIGAVFHDRIARALGDDADPAVLRAVDLATSGAMLQAGMGHVAYAELPDRLAEVAAVVLGGNR
jgi:AcrR family transcriptional regulator